MKKPTLIICGGMHQNSASQLVCNYLSKLIMKKNVIPVMLKVRETQLPLRIPEFDDDTNIPVSAREIRTLVQNSGSSIWVFPVYHGSMPGSFKNLLDFIDDGFAKKPVSIITVSGGGVGGQAAWTHAGFIAQTLHAQIIPIQIYIQNSSQWHEGDAIESDGTPKDRGLLDRMEKLINETLDLALRLSVAKSM